MQKTTKIIAVLSGDGIGPEVMKEAIKLLEIVRKRHNLRFELKYGDIGGAAYDRYGSPLPEETKKLCQGADAVLLGSVGGKKWDNLPPEKQPETGGLLALRRMLKLYANIRPLICYKELLGISPLSAQILNEGVDFVVVRELAGGIYFSHPKSLSADSGLDTMLYNRNDVLRIAHLAFQTAASRGMKLTSVDKANVLNSSRLWRSVVNEVAAEYPEIEVQHMYVDNAAMQMILNPQQFDVILTTNLFGDILSDESAAICGSLGMLPSVSIGDTTHLYEPAGGSAPDIAGKGIANPVAMLLSAALMLDHTFKNAEASKEIFYAVKQIISQGYRTPDIAAADHKPVTTEAMGDAVCGYLYRMEPGHAPESD